ncbi:unnamed protein product, partial [Ixodes persulcatus]
MDTPNQFRMKSCNLPYKDSGKLESLGSRTSTLKSSQRKMAISWLAEFTHERFELVMRNRSGMSTMKSMLNRHDLRSRHASPDGGSISRCAGADVSYVIGLKKLGTARKKD